MVDRKRDRILIYSFLLLNLYGLVTYVEIKYGVPQIIKYVLSVTVLSVLIWYRIKNPTNPEPGKLINLMVIIFVLWSVFLLIASLLKSNGVFYFQRILGVRIFLIPYLLPLIILYTKFDLDFFANLFYYSSIFIIPAVIIQVIVIGFGLSRDNWIEQSGWIRLFDICSPFLLLTAHFSKKKSVFYIVLVYYLMWTFLWTYYGKRGMLIDNILFLGFMIFLRLRSPFMKHSERMKMYFSVYLIAFLIVGFGYLLASTYVFQRGFDQEAFDSSRGSVFEAFFFDFNSMSDWIIGRGIDGTVMRSLLSNNDYMAVENGFLTILLKGGLLYAVPFLLILLRAGYLGFFKSNNDLTKALAVYIFIFVLMMGYFNLPDYSTPYILFWLAASACLSQEVRKINNVTVWRTINSRF